MQHGFRAGIGLPRRRRRDRSEPGTPFPIDVGAARLQRRMLRIFNIDRNPTDLGVDRRRRRRREVVLGLVLRLR